MTAWRWIIDDGVTAASGLAVDETLARRAGRRRSPPTLRTYTYRSHCALVGRFQNVENEIHVDYCRRHGVPINRRPTGGGAILMGRDQLGVALAVPADADFEGRTRDMMARFSATLVGALDRLGIDARFRGKNDVEVGGKKIAGLGLYRCESNGSLFHASLLIDLDVPLMLRVLRTPFEKITAREIATVAERITTVRREADAAIRLDETREIVANMVAEVYGVSLVAGALTADERDDAAALERSKYAADEWRAQTTDVPDTCGGAKTKTPDGLLDVRVALAGRMLKAVHIGGDFFAPDGAVADLEARLRWHPANSDAIAATVRRARDRWPDDLGAPFLEALADTIVTASKHAIASETGSHTASGTNPYGCFVSPRKARAHA